MSEDSDKGLRVLLENLRQGENGHLSQDLVTVCYVVLKEHMFDADQDMALVALRRLIEGEATRHLDTAGEVLP